MHELDRFQLRRLQREQARIKVRPQRERQADQKQHYPECWAGEIAPSRPRRRTQIRQLIATTDTQRKNRQQRRQHHIASQQTEQQSTASNDPKLGGAAKMRQHRYEKCAGGPHARGVDRQRDMVEDANPNCLRMRSAGHFLSIAREDLHQIIHADANQRQKKNDRKQVQLANRESGPAECPADANSQSDFTCQRQPQRAQHYDKADEYGDQRDHLSAVGIAIGGAHLVGLQRRPAGHSDFEFWKGFRDFAYGRSNRLNRLGNRRERVIASAMVDAHELDKSPGRRFVGHVVIAKPRGIFGAD